MLKLDYYSLKGFRYSLNMSTMIVHLIDKTSIRVCSHNVPFGARGGGFLSRRKTIGPPASRPSQVIKRDGAQAKT
jgi:hypothetical protein